MGDFFFFLRSGDIHIHFSDNRAIPAAIATTPKLKIRPGCGSSVLIIENQTLPELLDRH